MAHEAKIHILGVGSDGLAGLTGRGRELLQQAEAVLGSEHALALIPELKAQRVKIGSDLNETVQLFPFRRRL